VEWDQDESGTRDVSVIPCTEPHLMQIVGKVDATKHFSDKYPSNGAWMNFFDKVCGPLVEKLMGAKIDPYGRFAAGAIYVFPESWERGDRDVWCGATARGESPLQWKNLTPFRGSIEGASQQVLSAPGTCFSSQNTPVACALPHEYEIVGHTALGDRPPPAEDDTDAWSQRAAACEVLAREFMKRPLAEGEQWGWVPVLPVSWDAGAREVQCTVGRYAGEQRVPTSGSLQG
jgi:hypothetical protein